MKYAAHYSTSGGDMWVNLGEYDRIGQARHALRGYAKAGNLIRITEINADAPDGQTIPDLIRTGQARIV